MKNTIIYINLDGFSYSYYEEAKTRGKTKIFDKLKEDGVLFNNLKSGIISITNPMQSAILSGAWSNKTNNFYQHYDKEEKRIVKHLRTNNAENVAQAFLNEGKVAVSIHQFMLENTTCKYGIKNCAYLATETMPSNYKQRFKILKDLLSKKEVKSGNSKFIYEEIPDFIALYCDDLDALGHNNQDYDGYLKRYELNEKLDDIIERIEHIQEEIMDVVNICKDLDIYNNITFLITTDHGMTYFNGKSLLPNLLKDINDIGIKASLVENRTDETEVILLPYTIECSVFFDKNLDLDKQFRLEKLLNSLPYVNKVIPKKELLETYYMDEKAPQYLLVPSKPNHFYKKDYVNTYYGASHDSLDETSQHIFGICFGNKVKRIKDYEKFITSIDLIPTICKMTNNPIPKDSQGLVYEELFDK